MELLSTTNLELNDKDERRSVYQDFDIKEGEIHVFVSNSTISER